MEDVVNIMKIEKKKPPSRSQVYCAICGCSSQQRYLKRHFGRKHKGLKDSSVGPAEAAKVRFDYEKKRANAKVLSRKNRHQGGK